MVGYKLQKSCNSSMDAYITTRLHLQINMIVQMLSESWRQARKYQGHTYQNIQ